LSAAYLLDVNVLIALADCGHEFHRAARKWRDDHVHLGWATCPLTENALLRILAQRGYVRSLGSPEQVLPMLRALRFGKGHEFWSDEVTFADATLFPSLGGVSPTQLTDIYLVGLAVRRGARFATFDNRVPAGVIAGGDAAIEIIPVS
jgi:toxin-antitoxin system PIN domain toxin